jgi:pimeloyl-ACP methyl ester carboxylesterase
MQNSEIAGPAGTLAVRCFNASLQGDPVVLLHPINSAGIVWTEVAADLDRPVVTVDLRGHGNSVLTGPFSVEGGYVPDVLAVLDGLGLDRAHLGGGSLGGTISVALAALHPKRVLTVTTFGSTLGTGLAPSDIETMVASLRAMGTADYFAGLLPQIVGPAYRAWPKLQAVMAEAVGSRPETVVAEILRSAFSTDIRHLAANVAGTGLSVVAVAGDADPTCPPAMSLELAATTGGRSMTMVGVGHLPMLEQPAQTAEILRAHIASAVDGVW